jgi:hypothetical protein
LQELWAPLATSALVAGLEFFVILPILLAPALRPLFSVASAECFGAPADSIFPCPIISGTSADSPLESAGAGYPGSAVEDVPSASVTPRILQLNFFFSLLAKIRALPFLFLFALATP